MATFFKGWMGYGNWSQSSGLVEPADATYQRRPAQFDILSDGVVGDTQAGTVGPAVSPWGQIAHVGLFDALTGGNLLLWYSLPRPITIQAGQSHSSSPGTHVLLLNDLREMMSVTRGWPSATMIGRHKDGRPVMTGVTVQIAGGLLTVQSPVLGNLVTMSNLPVLQPAGGSGLLWNNGGVISVA